MTSDLDIYRSQLADFCQRRRIRELAIFGSATSGELRPDSDIDVLVDFLPQERYSLLDLVDMKEELEEVFGRPVDLLTRGALDRMRNRFRKANIENGLRKVYESGS